MFRSRQLLRCSSLFFVLLISLPLLEVSAQRIQRRSFSPGQFRREIPVNVTWEADGYYHLGVENLREPSNSDRAIEHLERAVDLDGTNAEYHYMLAEAYLSSYQYAGLVKMPFIAPKVKTHLELAVQYNPQAVEYREALVQYYVVAPAIFGGSFAKAHDQAKEIAKLDPYLGLLARASVYAGEGEGEKALTAYKSAIRMNPSGWEAYQRLGSYYLDVQEIDRAIEMFRLYVGVAPDQSGSYHHLGRAYQQKQMYAEAIIAFMKALEKDPTASPLVFRIAQLHEFRGNGAAAREYYQRYLSMVPSGRAADDARIKVRELAR